MKETEKKKKRYEKRLLYKQDVERMRLEEGKRDRETQRERERERG